VAVLSFEQELQRAKPQVPFSNGFEYDSWSSIWCEECVHEPTCPLLLVILHEKTPAAWREIDPLALNRYHCDEFEEPGHEDPQG
jgi:hypothetical protein